MATLVDLEDKIATGTGFHNGARVRPGAVFRAPVSFTGKWFRPASEAPVITETKDNPFARALDNPILDVVGTLPDYSVADLHLLLSAEQSGAARKGLLSRISDEIANRVGKEDEAFS